MKKVFAFILLFCHLNTTMFLPRLGEVDVFDREGKQVDDINSFTEYVDEVVLGNTDESPEDEDDDSSLDLNIASTCVYFFQPSYSDIPDKEMAVAINQQFPDYLISEIASVSYDIFSPPPEA